MVKNSYPLITCNAFVLEALDQTEMLLATGVAGRW